MAQEFSRTQRLAEQIHRELAELLLREVKDPRVGMVTLGEVKVSADLAHAKIYYTVMGDEPVRLSTQRGLEKAAGFLRSQLGKRLHIRVTPELQFIFDDTPQRGDYLDELIARARAKDRLDH
jgi:ribosome-binding factor A